MHDTDLLPLYMWSWSLLRDCKISLDPCWTHFNNANLDICILHGCVSRRLDLWTPYYLVVDGLWSSDLKLSGLLRDQVGQMNALTNLEDCWEKDWCPLTLQNEAEHRKNHYREHIPRCILAPILWQTLQSAKHQNKKFNKYSNNYNLSSSVTKYFYTFAAG